MADDPNIPPAVPPVVPPAAPPADPPAPKPPTPPADPAKEPSQDNEANKWRRLAEKAQADATAAQAELKKRTDAELSEVEREKQAREAAETERDTLRSENLRRKVAAEHGVPADAFEFLTGADEASLVEQATKLTGMLKAPPPPSGGTVTNPPGAGAPSMADRIAAAEKAGNRFLSIQLKRQQAGFSTE